jgi:hypothetical protein
MSWISRLKHALHPKRLDTELAEEMQDHLERRAATLRQGGLDTDEAKRQAARRFGNLTKLDLRRLSARTNINQIAMYDFLRRM